MKKGLKLLSLAMLFALPLAACGDNSGSNTSGNQEGGQQQEGGGQEEGGGSGGGGGEQGGGGQEEGGGGSGGGGGGQSQDEVQTITVDFSKLGYADQEEIGTKNLASDLTLSAKNDGSTPVKWFDNGSALRVYGGDSLVFESKSGAITKIELTLVSGGKSNAVSAQPGSIADRTTWTGSSNKVTITVDGTGGHVRYSGAKITYSGKGGSGGGEEGGGGSGGGQSTDLEDILVEICFYTTGQEENLFEYDSDDDSYYFGLTWGTTSEYTLLSAVQDAAEYLPEAFVYEVEEPYEDEWLDGDAGAFATYCTEDETTYCEIGSYEDDGEIVIQFCVYEE